MGNIAQLASSHVFPKQMFWALRYKLYLSSSILKAVSTKKTLSPNCIILLLQWSLLSFSLPCAISQLLTRSAMRTIAKGQLLAAPWFQVDWRTASRSFQLQSYPQRGKLEGSSIFAMLIFQSVSTVTETAYSIRGMTLTPLHFQRGLYPILQ